jgi:hypothetical protein
MTPIQISQITNNKKINEMTSKQINQLTSSNSVNRLVSWVLPVYMEINSIFV